MEEFQQTYARSADDPEATVVQPRFDALEARTAQPVVPLSRVAAWRQRRLPVALVLVSALFGGLVSVFAYRIYQRAAQPHATPQAASQQPVASPELSEHANAAPAQAESTPIEQAKNETPNASPHDAPAGTAAVTEEGGASRGHEGAARATRTRAEGRAEEPAARERRRRDEAAPALRTETRARRVEVITSPSAVERVKRERRDEGDEQPAPYDGRPARRGRGRNIDRIRDIFGAPPPA